MSKALFGKISNFYSLAKREEAPDFFLSDKQQLTPMERALSKRPSIETSLDFGTESPLVESYNNKNKSDLVLKENELKNIIQTAKDNDRKAVSIVNENKDLFNQLDRNNSRIKELKNEIKQILQLKKEKQELFNKSLDEQSVIKSKLDGKDEEVKSYLKLNDSLFKRIKELKSEIRKKKQAIATIKFNNLLSKYG